MVHAHAHAHAAASHPAHAHHHVGVALALQLHPRHVLLGGHLQDDEAVAVRGAKLGAVLFHRRQGFRGRLKLHKRHAAGAAIRLHDDADAVGLDGVPREELPHLCVRRLEGHPLDLDDAVAAQVRAERVLHLAPRHQDQPHKAVAKLLLVEDLVVLLRARLLRVLAGLKVHKRLSDGLEAGGDQHLDSVCPQGVVLEEGDHVQLLGVHRQPPDAHHRLGRAMLARRIDGVEFARDGNVLNVCQVIVQQRVHAHKPVTVQLRSKHLSVLGCGAVSLLRAVENHKGLPVDPTVGVLPDQALLARELEAIEEGEHVRLARLERHPLQLHYAAVGGHDARHLHQWSGVSV
mmetsp:Transcript_42475/g.108713  ORF Transcript_42475/g.108713 Transcript_42475/m.108713 type:complete len:346 (+) Transcript_42475:1436-2473(+)